MMEHELGRTVQGDELEDIRKDITALVARLDALIAENESDEEPAGD